MTPFAALGELEKSGSHMEKQAFGGLGRLAARTLGRLGGKLKSPWAGGARGAAEARTASTAAGRARRSAERHAREAVNQARNVVRPAPMPSWVRRNPMLTAAGAGATGLGAASYASSKKEEDPEENKSKGWNIGNLHIGGPGDRESDWRIGGSRVWGDKEETDGTGSWLEMGGKRIWP